MQVGEVSELCYTTIANQTPNYSLCREMALQDNMPSIQLSRFLMPLPHCEIVSLHDFVLQSKSPFVGDKSPSDKAEEYQPSVVDERRQRRMISNRESARRSRMRKQKHLDELWSQVLRLRNENRQLIDKLNQVSDSHDRILKENSTLREEATELRRMLHEVQLKNHPYCSLRELEVPCNTAHLRAKSSNQSIASSIDLLH
ncbi:hypothetical protein Sjap_024088 [Stephania japonica]|uniref:BZIP domain-containing protein n=1 Tax=Stephania japonica TaxID=461633 RepID=A0AAP0ECT9_9MAGN